MNSSIRNGIYKLLTTVENYGRFSNTGWKKPQPPAPTPNSLSLESFHNAIHSTSLFLTYPVPIAPKLQY